MTHASEKPLGCWVSEYNPWLCNLSWLFFLGSNSPLVPMFWWGDQFFPEHRKMLKVSIYFIAQLPTLHIARKTSLLSNFLPFFPRPSFPLTYALWSLHPPLSSPALPSASSHLIPCTWWELSIPLGHTSQLSFPPCASHFTHCCCAYNERPKGKILWLCVDLLCHWDFQKSKHSLPSTHSH